MSPLRLGAVVVGSAAALASLVGLARGEDAAPATDPHAESVELFSHHCASCHEPPDPTFAVDRIWLDQVRKTA